MEEREVHTVRAAHKAHCRIASGLDDSDRSRIVLQEADAHLSPQDRLPEGDRGQGLSPQSVVGRNDFRFGCTLRDAALPFANRAQAGLGIEDVKTSKWLLAAYFFF